MSAPDMTPPDAPPRDFRWIKYLLVASLAVNLLFAGGAVARFFVHGPVERYSGLSQMQLIPRRFLGELDGGRRAEILKVFRDFAPSFRDGRKAVREEAMNLAAALEAEPYDAGRVKDVIDSFSSRSSDLVRAGGEAALKVIAMLSPGERKLLAQNIRMRDDDNHRKGPRGKDGDD